MLNNENGCSKFAQEVIDSMYLCMFSIFLSSCVKPPRLASTICTSVQIDILQFDQLLQICVFNLKNRAWAAFMSN